MEQPTYDFSGTFQRKLAGYALFTSTSLLQYGIIQPEYFDSPYIAHILKRALQYMQEKKYAVTPAILHDLIQQDVDPDELPHYAHVLNLLKKPVNPAEATYVVDAATKFARLQHYKLSLQKSIQLLKDGDIDQLDRLMEQTLSFGRDMDNLPGMKYFSGIDHRNVRRSQKPEVIKTLIGGLDEALEDGGYAKNELHLLAGLPSSGKSFALDYLAKVSIIQKKKVVLYTLEMSELRVASRLDASFSGIPIRELRDNRDTVAEKVSRYGKKYGDNLLIKAFPAGRCRVKDIEAHLDRVKLDDFTPDVVLIDYVNLLATEGSGKRWRDLGQVYIDLRGMAQERDAWLFTACQSNRGGFDSELLTMKNISESFEGAMHADTIVTLNRSDEEARRETLRLYVAKDRNGLDKRVIKIFTNYSKGSFYRRN